MPNETHLAPPRYTIPDFFSSLLGEPQKDCFPLPVQDDAPLSPLRASVRLVLTLKLHGRIRLNRNCLLGLLVEYYELRCRVQPQQFFDSCFGGIKCFGCFDPKRISVYMDF